jgi:hypothetical protein
VWHKAIFDHASDLNLAINEMFNLILDGGMAAVWGTRQLRIEDLEDPSQVEGGIRPGMTLAVKQTLPANAKVLETVVEGDIPQDALAVFQMLMSEYNQASMSSDTKLGALPPTNQRTPATAILESSQTNNMMLDGMIADLENEVIAPLLRKAWLNILQSADDIPNYVFQSVADRRTALLIMRASPEERFSMFAGKCQFRAHGLSSTLTRALDFQKIMAFLQAVSVDPMLKQAFMLKFSSDKIIRQLLRTLNLNPSTLEKDPEELKQSLNEMQGMAGMSQILGAGPKNSQGQPAGIASGPGTGGSPTTAAIQQQANPATGMPNA